METSQPLRALTFLSPGLPFDFFVDLCRRLGQRLGVEIELRSERSHSGPMAGDPDPFERREADFGFLCGSSYAYLSTRPAPSVRLVGAGFVFDAPRTGGLARYDSEVIVRAQDGAGRLEDLAGRRFAFNDACSLSGYLSLLQAFADRGYDAEDFRVDVCTGSHHRSIEAVLAGDVDAAAIDSTVLAHARTQRPELAEVLRVVETLGPFPIQPVVVREELHPSLGARLEQELLAVEPSELAEHGWGSLTFDGFARIEDAEYDEERAALSRLGRL